MEIEEVTETGGVWYRDDSSDEEEIEESPKTLESESLKYVEYLFKRKADVTAKSFLLHSLGRVYYAFPIRKRYSKLKAERLSDEKIKTNKPFPIKQGNKLKKRQEENQKEVEKLAKKFFKDHCKDISIYDKNGNEKPLSVIKDQIEAAGELTILDMDLFIKYKRPILGYVHKYDIVSLKDLLVNVKLINRSETRKARNEDFQPSKIEINNKQIWVDLSIQNRCSYIYKNRGGSEGFYREEKVSSKNISLPSYHALSNKITTSGMKDSELAGYLLSICRTGKNNAKRELTSKQQELINLLYVLLFTTEVTRSPAALISNLQMLDLIAYQGLTFKKFFKKEKLMPMAIHQAVSVSSTMQRKYKETKKLPCHYMYHCAFDVSKFGGKTKYPIDSKKLKGLRQKEAYLLDLWLNSRIHWRIQKSKIDADRKKIFKRIKNDPKLYIAFATKEIDAFMKQFGLNIQQSSSSHEMLQFIEKIRRGKEEDRSGEKKHVDTVKSRRALNSQKHRGNEM